MTTDPVTPLRDRVRRRLAMVTLLAMLFATPLAVFVFGSDGPAGVAGSALAPVDVDAYPRGPLADDDTFPVIASVTDAGHAGTTGRDNAPAHNGTGGSNTSNGIGDGRNGTNGNGSNGDLGGFLVSSVPVGLPLLPEIAPDAIDPPLAINLFPDGHGPRADRGSPWAIASGPANAPRRTGGGSGGAGGSGGSGSSADPDASRGVDGHGNTDSREETGRSDGPRPGHADPRFEADPPAVPVPAPAPLWLMLGLLALGAWLRRVRPSACGAAAR